MESLRQQIQDTFGVGIDLSGGIRKEFFSPIYIDRPDFFPYQSDGKISLRKTIVGWKWPLESDYVRIDSYPNHDQTPYATKTQGMTHFDDRCWVFTQDPPNVQGKIDSVDVRQDLVNYPASTSTVITETNRPFGGNNHFGGCASDEDLLVIPSHDQQPCIAIFYRVTFSSNDKLSDSYYKPSIAYISNSNIQAPQNKGGSSVPWYALIPSSLTGDSSKLILVSSFFRNRPPEDPGPELDAGPNMFFYEIDNSTSVPFVVDPGDISPGIPVEYPIEFRDKSNNVIQPRRIQGGVVSSAGHLYISCDLGLTEGIGGGIHGFDLTTGRRIVHLPVDAGKKSSYEIEDVDIWDLDAISNSGPVAGGQIHLSIFDPDFPSADEMYIAHWRLPLSKRGLI